MLFVQCTSGENLSKTFFVSIASQDDEELKHTIRYIFENADHPENVRVGVGMIAMKKKSLSAVKKLSKKYNVSLKFIKQKKNDLSVLGIGKGRSLAASLYENEDYMIQIDCHSFFDSSWDTKLLKFYKKAESLAKDKNIVLTLIPPAYRYCCSKHKDPIKYGATTRYPYYEPQNFFVNVIPKWTEKDILLERSEELLPVSKVSPAFIMGPKTFGNDPGIYKDATFYDEDLTQSVNLFGRGFAFVFVNVENFPVRHLDSDGIVKGHKRFFILDYLNEKNNKILHLNMQNKYLKFVKDPKNKEAIDKYKKYARVDPLKGCFVYNANVVPESFR